MKIEFNLSGREMDAIKVLFETVGAKDITSNIGRDSAVKIGPMNVEEYYLADGSCTVTYVCGEGFFVDVNQVLIKHAPVLKSIAVTAKGLFDTVKYTFTGLANELERLVKESFAEEASKAA